MRQTVLMGLAAMCLTGCSSDHGDHWKKVGELPSGGGGLSWKPIELVQIDPGSEKSIAVYRDADHSLCGYEGKDCIAAFFLPGDKMPPEIESGTFMGAGGWQDYSPLAIIGGDGTFTTWDCKRAGDAEAPSTAMCGKVGENTKALLDLAVRVAWTTNGCDLPATKDNELAHEFITKTSAKDSNLGANYQEQYQSMVDDSASGPDDPADCQRLAAKIQSKANAARKTIEGDMPI